jgi:DNA-binding MarR family transcriptional regulator
MMKQPTAIAQLRALVEEKRLVSEIHRGGRLFLRLTDQGRSALAQIDEQERRARIVA